MIEKAVSEIRTGRDLPREEMATLIDHVMQGKAEPQQLENLLLALKEKGESIEEIAGAADAMRKHMTKIPVPQTTQLKGPIVDTCGTGGDGTGTFNISTAAAIVAAAAGVVVAKHGNRKISSKTGSADVLAELGVNIEADVPTVAGCLEQVGLCFCFAPLMHGAMKHVAAVRRKLGVPTIFNLLGPLCNPASAPFQVMGVGRDEQRLIMGQALLRLGTQHAVIVHGEDGLGEISNSSPTRVTQVKNGQLTETVWTPHAFGLEPSAREPLNVETPPESADLIRGILDGKKGAPRDVVVLNSAAAIWIGGVSPTLIDAASLAAEVIDNGKAFHTLKHLVQVSNA